jgi:hypothetical protein
MSSCRSWASSTMRELIVLLLALAAVAVVVT